MLAVQHSKMFHRKTQNSRNIISEDPLWVRIVLVTISTIFIIIFLLLPLMTVFFQAFSKGLGAYVTEISDQFTIEAIKLTLLTALFALTFNIVFGLTAAWLITKYTFKGKSLLITIMDMPFTISPVISGMIFILFLGNQSTIGKYFAGMDIQLIFATPGIVIATMFVTFPYIVRELIPLMTEQGREEEESALVLGASGFKIFYKVTLPNIKWSLLYGIILCNARAMGEFGAVSVVSGHIRGLTNTMPLHIEILYNEYNTVGAFAVASLLTLLAVITLILKSVFEWIQNKKLKRALD